MRAMRVVALISGGKDSTYNMMQCIAAGHKIVALANIAPNKKDELDSYMYQTVGHEGIKIIGEALGLPLYRKITHGKAEIYDKQYVPTNNDEVEDLFELLQSIKKEIEFDAVAVGAILSDYQRIRVENVCSRLGLISLAYLWRRNQVELLDEIIESGIGAVIIKVAALGLEPTRHLGVPLNIIRPHLLRMHEKYGLNVCGEGGEYETFTLDCPLYKSTIVVDESETIIHSDDAIAPVGYLNFRQLRLVPKDVPSDISDRLTGIPVKTPLSFIDDIDDNEIEICDEEVKEDEEEKTLINEVEEVDNYVHPDISNLPYVEHLANYNITPGGWLWIGGVSGSSEDPVEAMALTMVKLQNCLDEASYSVQDVCAITMYISDMHLYSELNKIYCETFKYPNPPVRVCVQCPLHPNTPVLLDALAYSKKKCTNADSKNSDEQNTKQLIPNRTTLHVQGISNWAPANIGPYSQATQVGDIIRVAGQIGMVPGTLELIEGGVLRQCQISLRHIGRIVSALDNNMQLRDVVQGVCYVTHPNHIEIARKEWEKRTNNAIVDYLVVSFLPKAALIEWHLWVHRHNNQFEYEETGQCVQDYLLSLRRRFNYENKVAVVVCHVEHRNATNFSNDALSFELILKCLDYALSKLNQDYTNNTPPVCNFRFFYPVNRNINIVELYKAIEENRSKYNIVYTIIPVCQLQTVNTLLSICGVRYE